MRITKYTTVLDENKHNILVKESSVNYAAESMNSPEGIVKMLNDCFQLESRAEEYLYAVALTAKGKVLGVFEVSHGTVSASCASPREIFIRLLLSGAQSFIVAHNHPSGVPHPSEPDITASRNVQEASKIMGIQMKDFIIIGDNRYYSFAESNLL